MKVIVVAGPTGIGKSRLALRLAGAAGGEIVNYDSLQIYRGFDIGTAKPDAADRELVPHHLFDIADAGEEFNAADYARLARMTCRSIAGRGRLPILVGGTFFYLRAFLAGLPEMPPPDPLTRTRIRAISSRPRGPLWLHRWLSRVDRVTAARVPPGDRHRLERAIEVWITSGSPISARQRPDSGTAAGIEPLKLALMTDRQRLRERLDRRVESMYDAGLVAETRALLERYPGDARPFAAIGYREAAAVISGESTSAEAVEETKRRTRAYAKRQMTWLRSERNVHWLDAADEEDTFRAAMQLVERFRLD